MAASSGGAVLARTDSSAMTVPGGTTTTIGVNGSAGFGATGAGTPLVIGVTSKKAVWPRSEDDQARLASQNVSRSRRMSEPPRTLKSTLSCRPSAFHDSNQHASRLIGRLASSGRLRGGSVRERRPFRTSSGDILSLSGASAVGCSFLWGQGCVRAAGGACSESPALN